MSKSILFTGINTIYNCGITHPERLCGKEMSVVPYKKNVDILVEEGKIVRIDTNLSHPQAEIIDLKGAFVLPGFVDSHTHAVFAATREEEFIMRIHGKTYEEIALSGGGILNSAKKMQEISETELFEISLKRIQTLISHGTTTLEIKSGYGLTVESELKMLRVIQQLKKSLPITIYATFLGAHAIPEAYKAQSEKYVDIVIHEMLPEIHNNQLADFVDVFCDKGFFSPEQTSRILTAASNFGLLPKIHANELGLTGGVQVGVAHHALSVDHLEHSGEAEFQALIQSKTIPVGLPGTSFFLGLPYTPVRDMVDFGLPVALASDFNPGSSPLASMQMVWAMGCSQMKLSPEEGFNAITVNAAATLNDKTSGFLFPGGDATFLTTHLKNPLHTIPYFFAQNHIDGIYLK